MKEDNDLDIIPCAVLHDCFAGNLKYKNEYLKLINFITITDPDAFVTVYAVNEMMYKPKEIN